MWNLLALLGMLQHLIQVRENCEICKNNNLNIEERFKHYSNHLLEMS